MIFPILGAKNPEEGVAESRLRPDSPHESQRMVTKPLSLSKYANLETSEGLGNLKRWNKGQSLSQKSGKDHGIVNY